MYKVIRFFRDLQDKNHAYHVGDSFPHDGVKVSEERLVELSTDANRRHMPLIEKVEDEDKAQEIDAVEAKADDATQEPVEGFMNPPEEAEEPVKEEAPKPKKKRGRPRNDAQ